jgi:hypothetical protein
MENIVITESIVTEGTEEKLVVDGEKKVSLKRKLSEEIKLNSENDKKIKMEEPVQETDEEKKSKLDAEIEKIKEDGEDTWKWLHDRTHEDCDILMELHRSTRALWRKAREFYFHHCIEKKKEKTDNDEKPRRNPQDKIFRKSDCYLRAHYWLAHHWANPSDWNKWRDNDEVDGDVFNMYFKSKGNKKGGAGMKALQMQFWAIKHKKLFPDVKKKELKKSTTSKTVDVVKAPKKSKAKISKENKENKEKDPLKEN